MAHIKNMSIVKKIPVTSEKLKKSLAKEVALTYEPLTITTGGTENIFLSEISSSAVEIDILEGQAQVSKIALELMSEYVSSTSHYNAGRPEPYCTNSNCSGYCNSCIKDYFIKMAKETIDAEADRKKPLYGTSFIKKRP